MNWLAIDFGTSVSSAAFIKNNRDLKKIKFTSPNDATFYDFPTTAWINGNGEILVGYEANARVSENPANYIFEFKLELDDPIVNIRDNVSYKDVIKAILQKIKQEAESDKNGRVIFTNAVITIPVDFKESAINKIKEAAVSAGFTKVEIVTEPQAAAIYFNKVSSKIQEIREFTALIYDMGCGTFDPAIINIKNDSTGVDYSSPINGTGTKKAGKYFDKLIQAHFEHTHPIPDNNRAQINRELKKKCKEEIKCILSGQESASTEVIYGAEGTKIFSLDRESFNKMIEPAIEESITKCQELLDSNKLNWQNIDVIFFVGGSCNIPYIRNRIETYSKRYNQNIQMVWNQFKETDLEPQYAVCLGAALYINHLTETTMNPKIYTDKRNTLLRIINKILQIDKLGSDKRTEFESINKKCLEDQFNIVLVGEFQGGKSTTFNTFCDGREISPRGAMVKTSACKVTARNLSDQSKLEYADVIWKTERELILNIEDILSKHISIESDLGINYQAGDERKPLSEILSFSNQEHFAMMNDAVSEEWKTYERRRAAYSTESLDILRIATIILRFVNTNDAKELRERSSVSITDISNIVVFPKDWEGKWKDGVNGSFSFAEIKFAFVASVDCYIHSPNLSRLGCTITDCPGLFASKWDTQVALDTIPKADAILYLLNGAKAIGTGDVASLREIQEMPAAHKKIFFAINLKNPRHVIESSIIPADVATINNIGFNITEQKIQRYHALLAFLGEFGQRYIGNNLDENSKSIFMSMTKQLFGCEMTIEQSWIIQATQHLMLTCIPPQAVDTITSKSVDKIRSINGFNELFNGIEEFIVKNKAEAILITNGAEKCFSALTNIENILKNREEEASENVNQREAELMLAKQTLIEFQTEAKAIVTSSFEESVFDQLKNNYYEDVLMASSCGICLIVAPKLDKKLTAGLGWKMIFKSDTERQELMKMILTPIYQDALSEILNKRTKVWLSSLIKGENESYKNSVSREIKRVNTEIRSKWEQVQTLSFKFPQVELPAPNELNKIVMQDDKVKSPIFDGDILGSFYKIARSNLVSEIIMHVIFSPVLLIVWVIQLSEYIAELFKGKPKSVQTDPVETNINSYDELSADQKKLYDRILPQLQSAFGNRDTAISLKKSIWQGLLSKIAKGLKNLYAYNIAEQEREFTKDYNIRSSNLKLSTDERKIVASEAKKLRTEQIEPCNNEIKVFMESTKKIIQGNGSK